MFSLTPLLPLLSRLQELKNLLLEAQKGPESLQEALKVQAGNHRLQQDEFRSLIDSLRLALSDAFSPRDVVLLQDNKHTSSDPPSVPLSALKELHISSKRTETLLEKLLPQLGNMEEGMGRMEGGMMVVKKLLEDKHTETHTKLQAETQTEPHTETQTEPHTEPQPLLETIKETERKDRWESEVLVRRLEETQRTLGERIRTNNVYNAVFTFSATAITVSAVYLLLRGNA